MKFCSNCQQTFPDQANMCGSCGGPLTYIPDQNQVQHAVNPNDHTAEYDPKDISDNKVFAMLPYILSIAGIIIAMLGAPDSPYTKYHIKHALKITVTEALLVLITAVLAFTIIVPIAAAICFTILAVVNIICFFRVCSGKAIDAPIISSLKFFD